MKNSLFVKILVTVILGIVGLSLVLSSLNLALSKNVFYESFSESQRKIFVQMDEEFSQFFSVVSQIGIRASTSWAVRQYLTDEDGVNDEFRTIYYMQEHLREKMAEEYNSLNVLLVGKNGKDYVINNARKTLSHDEILESDAAKKAEEHAGKLICEYEPQGYTDDQKEPVLVMARTLSYESEESDGIIFVTIKESEFKKMYDYFTSATSDIVILNQDEEVMSSNNRSYQNQEEALKEKLEKTDLALTKKIQGTNFQMIGIVDPSSAFREQYDIKSNILLVVIITMLVCGTIFIFIRQQTRPLSKLAMKMSHLPDDHFRQYVEIEGPSEVQELSKTYNMMLERINEYFEQMMRIQEEKRNAEIHALQMQINPHYIYNTLATIKWLIWQGDTQKSTKVIDAFILLLRNTISNTDEFVTVEQEIDNLKNYVLINQTRYGDSIGVEYYVPESCKHYKIPKLILQPFVENAFFHGFPEGMSGEISVFVREQQEHIYLEIVDNGVGMDTIQVDNLKYKRGKKTEHFTGIGVNNVDDRIQLIYGAGYGVRIVSEKGNGTKISIVLPKGGLTP